VFWGNKGVFIRSREGEVELRILGTAGRRLADVREGIRYVGLGTMYEEGEEALD